MIVHFWVRRVRIYLKDTKQHQWKQISFLGFSEVTWCYLVKSTGCNSFKEMRLMCGRYSSAKFYCQLWTLKEQAGKGISVKFQWVTSELAPDYLTQSHKMLPFTYSCFCSPQQCQLAPPVGPAPLAVVFCSLERRAPVPSPSGVSTQPTLVLSLELTSRAQVSVPSPCLSISGCAVQGGMQMICAALSLLCPLQSAAVLLGDFEAPPSQLISPSVRWLTRVWVPFLFNSSFSSVLVLYWFLFSLSFLLFYPVMWRVSCPLWRFKVFFQHPADVLCKSHLDVLLFFFFNVLVGEGECHVILLCHLDPSLQTHFQRLQMYFTNIIS